MKNVITFISNEIAAIIKSIRESYKAAPPSLQTASKRILGTLLTFVIIAIVWHYGSLYYERTQREAELAKGPVVKTAKAVMSPADRTVELSGEARPYASVTLYAKVSGYLKTVKVDKGDVVKKGQILAVIESPETDKAYDSAMADAKNKKSINDRMQKLLQRNLVSAQEAEQAQSDADQAEAHFESQRELKNYEMIRAPFDGTIVARYADPGALMQNAANSQTSALPVVAISQVNELRVYVYLDQRDALYVEKGQLAMISLEEKPDLQIQGHVERISGQLDEKTRMLLTEIDVDNNKEQIVAGSLVKVALHLKSTAGIEIPSEALILRDGQTVVPIIDQDNLINYSNVKVIENNGHTIKIQSGLKEGQLVALALGNTLPDKAKVRPQVEAPKAGAGGAAAPGTGVH